MTEQELWDLVGPSESPGVEFKSARASGDKSFPEVAKAALGMVNRRNGGRIVVGIDDSGQPTGLSTTEAASWRKPDHVRQLLSPFSDYPIYIDVVSVTGQSVPALAGRTFVVIRVHPFEHVPVFCKKSALEKHGKELLKAGAVYVRSNVMPATTVLADGASMRELIDLATERALHRLVTTLKGAGIDPQLIAQGAAEGDAKLFSAQEGALLE